MLSGPERAWDRLGLPPALDRLGLPGLGSTWAPGRESVRRFLVRQVEGSRPVARPSLTGGVKQKTMRSVRGALDRLGLSAGVGIERAAGRGPR